LFVLAAWGLTAIAAPAQAPTRSLVDPKAGARYEKAKAALDETTKFYLDAKAARDKLPQLVPSEQTRLEREFKELEQKVAAVNKKIEKTNAGLDKFKADVAARNRDANKTDADFDAFRQRATKLLTEGSEVREAASKEINPLAIRFVADVERAIKAGDTVKEYASKRVGYDDSEKKQVREAEKTNKSLPFPIAQKKSQIEADKTKLTNTALELQSQDGDKYKPREVKVKDEKTGEEKTVLQTQCNAFLRDFAKRFTGLDMPEFAGQDLLANQMFDNLVKSGNFKPLGLQKDPKDVFQKAQELADEGRFVVVAYKKPDGHGHVAVVVPADGDMETSDKWGMKVPYIAQAGESVFSKGKLSEGFGPDKLKDMEVFVLAPRTK
jgi:hypothetical protein